MASICSGVALLIRTTATVEGRRLSNWSSKASASSGHPRIRICWVDLTASKPFSWRNLRSMKTEATVAVTRDRLRKPMTIRATPTSRPMKVTGTTSPYPTVVRVTRPHHKDRPNRVHHDPSAGSTRLNPMDARSRIVVRARTRPKTLSRCSVRIKEATDFLITTPQAEGCSRIAF
jgi:hypothetical protein